MKALTVCIFLLLIPCLAVGQQITSVTGTTTHGLTLRIEGNGFGTKSPVAPYLWDDFETGTVGAFVGSGSHGKFSDGIKPDLMKYSSTGEYNGDQCGYGIKPESDSVSAVGLTSVYRLDIGYSDSAFMHFKWKMTTSSGSYAQPLIKLARLNSALLANGSVDPTHGFPNYTQGSDRGSLSVEGIVNIGGNNCGAQDYVGSIGTNYNYGVWNSTSLWGDIGTRDVANGMAGREINGNVYEERNIQTFFTVGSDPDQPCLLYGGDGDGYGNFDMCYIAGSDDIYLSIDDVYGDTTLSRVMLGDNAVLGSCTVNEMQYPTRWDAGGGLIEVTVNTGTLVNTVGTDGGVYLFVFDADGYVMDGNLSVAGTQGFALVLDETIAPSGVDFTAPTNLTVSGGN